MADLEHNTNAQVQRVQFRKSPFKAYFAQLKRFIPSRAATFMVIRLAHSKNQVRQNIGQSLLDIASERPLVARFATIGFNVLTILWSISFFGRSTLGLATFWTLQFTLPIMNMVSRKRNTFVVNGDLVYSYPKKSLKRLMRNFAALTAAWIASMVAIGVASGPQASSGVESVVTATLPLFAVGYGYWFFMGQDFLNRFRSRDFPGADTYISAHPKLENFSTHVPDSIEAMEQVFGQVAHPYRGLLGPKVETSGKTKRIFEKNSGSERTGQQPPPPKATTRNKSKRTTSPTTHKWLFSNNFPRGRGHQSSASLPETAKAWFRSMRNTRS